MTVKARKKHDIIKAQGTARYAHLNEPNKRFDEYGVWSCDLVIDDETKQGIVQKLKPIYEAELRDIMEANPGKKIEQKGLPFSEVDGGHMLKAKLKAGGRRRDGTEYQLSIALFDSQGNKLPEDVQVWGGSKVNVAFRPKFWYVPSQGFGVTFELSAVQVIELSNGGVNSPSADAFGFTSEEGYIANGGENLDSAFDAEETEETTLTANF